MEDASFVIPAPPRISVPVEGSDAAFPVRRIYCVGRNYAEHVKEMGGDTRQPPFFFQKPTDAIVVGGDVIPYPAMTADFQHEVELVLAIGSAGTDIPEEQAAEHVFGLGVGIDLTRRDLQLEARNTGRPWEIGKAFDMSAPIGPLRPLGGEDLGLTRNILLSVNGQVRQESETAAMIWSSAEIIARLSAQYRLEPGDLIYTGTPAGVGPLAAGDVVEAHISGLPALSISIIER